MVLAEVTHRLQTDPTLIAFAKRVPREGRFEFNIHITATVDLTFPYHYRIEYMAQEAAAAAEIVARANAKVEAAELAQAQKAAATAQRKQQKKKNPVGPPKSAPFSSSLDDALGKSVPRSS